MPAALNFFAGENFSIHNLSGSGLGFYGDAGFGAAILVGSYQGRTFITNAAGTAQGPEVDNIKYLNSHSGIIGQTGSGVSLLAIPNYQATLNIRFTNDTAVVTQNAQVRVYDRNDINNNPSGVICQVAQLIHPWNTQSPLGSGSSTWTDVKGSGSILNLTSSPGTSGWYNQGTSTSDTQHDFYLALSVSPQSVSSKLFALYCTLEYL